MVERANAGVPSIDVHFILLHGCTTCKHAFAWWEHWLWIFSVVPLTFSSSLLSQVSTQLEQIEPHWAVGLGRDWCGTLVLWMRSLGGQVGGWLAGWW